MKKAIIAALVIIIPITAYLGIKTFVLNSAGAEILNSSVESSLNIQEHVLADRIEVVHFHANHQCWSCITVGEYALQTIKDKFPEEYQSGKIVFKDINVELPENKDIVTRYQARGSSLFVNAVKNGQDEIKEDVKVWNLIRDKDKFTQYFEDKLKILLGK